ncbi:DUF2889 domain-containing protein [Alkalilimnicola ehrlichii]|uniref:DUF2889 domain-containing protein n=1 Tax=Alkalilimnicola ehrlichii TaxID=351052 RepID=UPI001C6E60FB|nr:DUF2889 domain-containing protein [Alkalilimnicola ehrlichii]
MSPAAPREPIHTRDIQVKGYRRQDGLWDIEAYLTDRKSYEHGNRWRGTLAVGEPVHDMAMRVTIDDNYQIHAVEATLDAHPFPSCPHAAASFSGLVGLRIGPGWLRQARRFVGGALGCTHLVELLGPIGTAAFQTLAPLKESEPEGRQALVDRVVGSCHGLRADGEAVRELYPEAYRGS